ncbi:MAG: EscU/YscU/HrcU family type III secretion system export apparatus switch protein [Clostridia bacterium]
MKQPPHSQTEQAKRKQAVALRYQAGLTDAPVVVAKGKGYIADNILKQAQEHKVPIQHDPSLVEVLGKLDLNQQIPPELYQVVAGILAFVYRMDQKGTKR